MKVSVHVTAQKKSIRMMKQSFHCFPITFPHLLISVTPTDCVFKAAVLQFSLL